MGSDQSGLKAETPTRVAYLVSRFPKLTETFVLYEALALQDLGVEVSVYPLVRHTEEIRHEGIARVEQHVHRVASLSPSTLAALLRSSVLSPLRFTRALRSLVRGSGGSPRHFVRALAVLPKAIGIASKLRTRGVDHVHAHFATHPALVARIVHDLTGIPYSFTAHGSDLHRDPRGLRAKVEASAFTVAISDYNRRFIIEHTGQDLAHRVEVLHCGADIGHFAQLNGTGPREKARAAVSNASQNAPFRIVCVAALREVKGHTYLLAALDQLAKRGFEFECSLAGDGPLRGALEQEISARGLTSRVHLLGPCTKARIATLLKEADVIVLTSIQDRAGRREGIPVSLMEGMAAGLPVVASDLSGIPELVEHGGSGLLAAPGDGGEIAEALSTLAADPELARRMGTRGRQIVESRFDLALNAQALAERIQAMDESGAS